MASLLDLVVPGVGSVAHALFRILQLCGDMREGRDVCTRLHVRLKQILDELQLMEDRGQFPSSDALSRYVAVVKKYIVYLQRYHGKKLVSRLIKHQQMMRELLTINESVDRLSRMLNLSTTAAVMDWKQQWEVDQLAQKKELAAMAISVAVVLDELQDMRSQKDAVMSLKFEVEERAARQTAETLTLLKSMLGTVLRASQTVVGKLPPWFFPSDDVDIEPMPFARGSFGTVHKGVWGAGARVAVKCLLVDGSEVDERVQQQIETEINVWHQLNHPNVIKMFGASHVSSPPFIVCEDATNGNLSSFLARSNDNQRQMWLLLYQAAIGLDYIHMKRVVHGDLKLSNILVGADGQAKLANFGLNAVRTCSTLSKTSAEAPRVLGGLRWRAPECLKKRPTFASDVYSFAMCMIEAATGEAPFGFLDDEAVHCNLTDGNVPEQPDEMSNEVWELVISMTDADPTRRLQLPLVLERLKVLAEAEETAETQRAAGTYCGVCMAMVSKESRFCTRCGTQVAAAVDSSLQPASSSDYATSLPPLIAVLRSGTAVQKLWATQTLGALACESDDSRVAIAHEGAISPLMALLRVGTTEQKQRAAYTLGTLADNNDNRVAIAREGGISSLIPLVRSGTDGQKEQAAFALGKLAWGNDDNCRAIAREGGLSPLVALVQMGTDAQKHWAAIALRDVAVNDDVNRLMVSRFRGIGKLLDGIKSM
ncbi:hypothetical protein BBJ28_00010754 [Nothophytophthora sp. Chile5]|nr:hypothetical protein BBJ28_00010754 [Nothophytophthora sp. Chile5]